MSSASNHGNYQKKKFEDHVAKCDGKNDPQINLSNHSSPYVPHFLKNKLYAFLYANKRLEQYRFLDEYITYDFETVTKHVNEHYGKSSFQDSTLHPLSVAWTIRVRNSPEISEFLYRAKMDESTFIDQWLNNIFKDAEKVHNSRESYYKSLKLPAYLQNVYLNYYRKKKKKTNKPTEEELDESDESDSDEEEEYDEEE
jgi:hypothetical protein